MLYIVLDRSAKDNYDRLDVNMTARVNDALNIISQNPFFGPNIKKLRGKIGQDTAIALEITELFTV